MVNLYLEEFMPNVEFKPRRTFVFCILGFGFWVLGFGFWVLGFGFWSNCLFRHTFMRSAA